MIAVLAFDTFEQGTDPVIDWLLYYQADFVRISINDICRTNIPWQVSIENQTATIASTDILNRVNVVWYRRFFHDFKVDSKQNIPHLELLEVGAKTEVNSLFRYCCRLLHNKKWMPDYRSFLYDEPEILWEAYSAGLKTPRSIVCNNKQDVINFNRSCPFGIITKASTDEGKSYYKFNKYVYFSYTHFLQEDDIGKLEEHFFPSLFQERIQAQYEMRIFYLDGNFYSTAILNKELGNEQADRKLFHKSSGTHQVRYKLPDKIEKQIDALMRKLNMNTGCIDMIRGKDEQYYFLEVNVGGQYLSQSVKCNYYLEEKIAKWLIENDK